RTANCRVVVRGAGSAEVIKRERDITNGGVFNGDGIKEKRGLAKSVVAESGSVRDERSGADSIVEDAISVTEQCLKANGGVVKGIRGLDSGRVFYVQTSIND